MPAVVTGPGPWTPRPAALRHNGCGDKHPTRMNATTSSCAGRWQGSTRDRCPWVFVPIAGVIAAILAHHSDRASTAAAI